MGKESVVVVLSENANQLHLISRVLYPFRLKIIGCQSRDQAYQEILKNKKVNLVIVDMSLSDGDGVEFLRLLRDKRQARLASLPLIVLSSTLSTKAAFVLLNDFKLHAFLTVPFQVTTFKQVLEKVLQGEKVQWVPRIMAIGASPNFEESMENVFKKGSYEFYPLTHYAEALTEFYAYHPDFIFWDLQESDDLTCETLSQFLSLEQTTVLVKTSEELMNTLSLPIDSNLVFWNHELSSEELFFYCQNRLRQRVASEFELMFEAKNRQIEIERHKMFRTSKMASFGEMAGNIAHEINTPLSTILTNAQYLLEDFNSESFNHKTAFSVVEKISKTVLRINQIIKGLKLISYPHTEGAFTKVKLKKICEDIDGLCGERFRSRDIAFQLDLNGLEELEIECQPVELIQVLVNLMNNAVDAIEFLPIQWIKLSFVEKDESVCMCVSDSGLGIPEEIQEKIMEPFFTTKELGKGTGLGLSISKEIIEHHHGRLFLDLNAVHTCFAVQIPKRQPQDKQEQSNFPSSIEKQNFKLLAQTELDRNLLTWKREDEPLLQFLFHRTSVDQ